jgi:hypothetical protein
MASELTPRQKRIAIGALANAIEHEPALRPVLVDDYANARLDLKAMRKLHETLGRRLASMSRHPDEPGSKSTIRSSRPWTPSGSRCDVKPGDGSAEFGSVDHTGFAEGCVY